ncbi:hypothetical protein SUZIE_184175 [Sciurus carolinensis]|uniref:Uncharacterized protein n=1 Tax=Sciurus carolinensis TaxID=30640 RepID=A0AA41N9A2_SCICA|nr:hypothetical protein [Sciurus carolinensis]
MRKGDFSSVSFGSFDPSCSVWLSGNQPSGKHEAEKTGVVKAEKSKKKKEEEEDEEDEEDGQDEEEKEGEEDEDEEEDDDE